MKVKIQELIEKDNKEAISFQPSVQLKEEVIIEEKISNKNITVYLHIPFCRKKCTFCGLLSTSKFDEKIVNNYVKSLINEIKRYSNTFLLGRNIEAIHFGGGTPSILSINDIKNIIATFKEYCNCSLLKEIIVEANPSSLSKEKIQEISEIDNLKLNIGIQTFDEKLLKTINRDDDVDEIFKVLQLAIDSKCKGVGVDLICGLPNSTKETLMSDIKIANFLGVEYISLYPLWVEENAVLKKYIDSKEVNIPGYYERKNMLIDAEKYLLKNGFKRVSSYHFVRAGLKNYIYSQNQMEGKEWIGIGVGSASYFNGHLLCNTSNIDEYIENDFESRNVIKTMKSLNKSEVILRELALNLRLMSINKKKIKKKYGELIFENLSNKLIKLKNEGLLEEDADEFKLTYDGILNFSYLEKSILNY